jgi:16S rRNA (cytosine967-C5)-methyltransferase
MAVASSLKTDSLAFALLGAARAVAAVKAGTALPQALNDVFSQTGALPAARGAMQDIAYRTMRMRGMAEGVLRLTVKRMPEPPLLNGVLQCALSLLLETEQPPYEAHTVVDQAVTAAASEPRIAHAKGLVNGVLRRFLRERDALTEQAGKRMDARWNYPLWWISDMQAAYPTVWQDMLRTGNTLPPLTLRVNQRAATVDDYLGLLSQHGMQATQLGPIALRLDKPVPVERIPGFADGLVSVQDAAAQIAAPLLDVQDGMRVLDACAAPGGKTGHLLESAQIDLLALDQDAQRLQRIEQNLQRLHLSAEVRQGDASRQDWWNGKPFDRILADVPCTASGIVRRHPDIRWLRRQEDAGRLTTLSGKILDNLWQMLRPGGKFLFVTCSVWPQESEQQAAAFEARQHAIRLPAPGQLLPVAQRDDDHDGLFYALFQKSAER